MIYGIRKVKKRKRGEYEKEREKKVVFFYRMLQKIIIDII